MKKNLIFGHQNVAIKNIFKIAYSDGYNQTDLGQISY